MIDLTESLANKLNLNSSRIDDNEISIILRGDKSDYNLTVILKQEYEMIYFSCELDIKVTKDTYNVMIDAIVKANERIWIGHFDLLSAENEIVYSVTIPFISSFLADELIIESTIRMIIEECDRFYHYFLMISKGDILCDTSIDTMFMEAVGEA